MPPPLRVIVTGASRGIGAAVARRFAAAHGADARVALLGRSLAEPSHPTLEGTLVQTARDVHGLGAEAVPVVCDMRDAEALRDRLRHTIGLLGGVDVLVNNASALAHRGAADAELVHAVNARGTTLCLEACAPHLEASAGAVVTIAPPVRLGRLEWIRRWGVDYTLSKYAMTLATLAHASDRVRARCLWPRRTVATAATKALEASGALPHAFSRGRNVHDVARAVHLLARDRDRFPNATALYDDEVVDYDDDRSAPLDAFALEE